MVPLGKSETGQVSELHNWGGGGRGEERGGRSLLNIPDNRALLVRASAPGGVGVLDRCTPYGRPLSVVARAKEIGR